MDHVLQNSLPSVPWAHPATARLPGVQPMTMSEWLHRDEAFAGQMALRDRLLATRGEAVLVPGDGAARLAAAELLEVILAHLDAGYRHEAGAVRRPDGVRVALDPARPLLTAARLVQEDLCLLRRAEGGEHVLAAAALCFPASWTLGEKIGRPLAAIHGPVAAYDGGMAARVQRLFDHLRPEVPLWRQNALLYADPALYQPRPEAAPRETGKDAGARYLRSERQCLLRLPRTGAVAFTIHTYVVPLAALPPEMRPPAKAVSEARP
jgi:hypothetical protein